LTDTFLEAARRLKASPERTVVIEDAIAGVAAGRAGNFGLVIGIDRTGHGTRRSKPPVDDLNYPGTYLAGGYNRLTTVIDGRPIENEDLVNLPNWLPLTFRIDEVPSRAPTALMRFCKPMSAHGHIGRPLLGQHRAVERSTRPLRHSRRHGARRVP
jgi:hypothetical protein